MSTERPHPPSVEAVLAAARRREDARREPDAVLHVFHDREGVVRDLLEELERERHSISAQPGGEAKALACEGADLVEKRERDHHEAGSPRRVGVADAVLGLRHGELVAVLRRQLLNQAGV